MRFVDIITRLLVLQQEVAVFTTGLYTVKIAHEGCKYTGEICCFVVGRSARDGNRLNPIDSKDQSFDKLVAPQSGNSPHFMEPESTFFKTARRSSLS
jgi:hypothetical protein